jgi:hypothetical protein
MYISLDDMARLCTYIAWMDDRRGLKLPRLFMGYMGWRMEGYFWLRLYRGVKTVKNAVHTLLYYIKAMAWNPKPWP